jgi:hypothetical protein
MSKAKGTRRTNPRIKANVPSEFELGFERICTALEVRTQTDLADMLDIHQSCVSEARQRGVIPGAWAVKLLSRRRLNPLWVYEGLPPVFVNDGADRREADNTSGYESFLAKYPADKLLGVSIDDSSMEPLICRPARACLYSGEKDIESGRIYGIDLPLEGLVLRRIVLAEDSGQCLLLAENPMVFPQRLPVEVVSRMIVGRAVWVMMAAH